MSKREGISPRRQSLRPSSPSPSLLPFLLFVGLSIVGPCQRSNETGLPPFCVLE